MDLQQLNLAKKNVPVQLNSNHPHVTCGQPSTGLESSLSHFCKGTKCKNAYCRLPFNQSEFLGVKPIISDIGNSTFTQSGSIDGKSFLSDSGNSALTQKNCVTKDNNNTFNHHTGRSYVSDQRGIFTPAGSVKVRPTVSEQASSIFNQISHTAFQPYLSDNGIIALNQSGFAKGRPFPSKPDGTISFMQSGTMEGMPSVCEPAAAMYTQSGSVETRNCVASQGIPSDSVVPNPGLSQTGGVDMQQQQQQQQSQMLDIKMYKCEHCDSSFAEKDALAQHSALHTKERPFVCGECNASFTQEFQLQVHKDIHIMYWEQHFGAMYNKKDGSSKPSSSDNKHVCEHCGATYKSANALKTHATKHTSERPYVCSDCNASFAQSYELKAHLDSHNRDRAGGSKDPVDCEGCKCKCSCKPEITHIRLPSGKRAYKCPECTRHFRTKARLSMHTRIHIGRKPHSCSICKASYASNASVARHMLIHSGERPFKCSECSAAFTQKTHLQKHFRLHLK